MYNVTAKRVPNEKWFTEKSKELVKNFNDYAKGHKSYLTLSFYVEPESKEDLEVLLDDGRYEFIYPKNNPFSAELEQMVEEADISARFLCFDLEDLFI